MSLELACCGGLPLNATKVGVEVLLITHEATRIYVRKASIADILCGVVTSEFVNYIVGYAIEQVIEIMCLVHGLTEYSPAIFILHHSAQHSH